MGGLAPRLFICQILLFEADVRFLSGVMLATSRDGMSREDIYVTASVTILGLPLQLLAKMKRLTRRACLPGGQRIDMMCRKGRVGK